MRRSLAALLFLSLAASAPAATITGSALGTVTRDTGGTNTPGPPPYVFTVGEAVSVTWTVDPDSPFLEFDARVSIGTSGGFSRTYIARFGSAVVTDGELTSLRAHSDPWMVELSFAPDGTGTMLYNRDLGIGDEGFRATLTRTVAQTPEPSSLLMGLVGMGTIAVVRLAVKSPRRP